MKKALTALATAAAAVAAIYAPLSAHAANTISFTGSLSATTCTISGNGGGSSFTVSLGSPAASSLVNAGDTTSKTPFSISLTGCSGGTLGTATTFFEAGPNITPQGRLLNTATTSAATNVELQLRNEPADSVIALNMGHGAQGVTAIDITSGSGTANFAVEFYATGAATAGAVTSSVTYTIDYQ